MFTLSDPRTEVLMNLLGANPCGVTLDEIAAEMRPAISLRTLRRWLRPLLATHLVVRTGAARGTRYYVGNGRFRTPVKKRVPKPPLVRPDPPAPPKPGLKPSGLPPEYRRVFDQVAGKIIRLGFVDDTARSELAMAACRAWRGCTPEEVNAFVLAAEDEFDQLDRATALAKYDVTAEQWTDWRKEWALLRNLPPPESDGGR
jgi:hypothetical protein